MCLTEKFVRLKKKVKRLMHEGFKVVSTSEMARVEKGGDHISYMMQAGRKVALAAIDYIRIFDLPNKVTLLVGKGNNGGDAYTAGLALLGKDFEVAAIPLYEEVSPLNKKFRDEFRKKGGRFTEEMDGLLIDGLLGTGFKGKLENKIRKCIQEANDSDCPIIAIDIPSGLNGSTGVVHDIAIQAKETVMLGLAKIGLFIEDGWKYVGNLLIGDFGLPKEAIAEAEAICYIPKRLELPEIERVRHKYEAGYVVGYAGSTIFKGAPKMAGLAALEAGAGIVRVFHPGEIGDTPLELIAVKWNAKLFKEVLKKAKAVFIGSGLGDCKKWLTTYLKEIKQPCVVDADALQKGVNYPQKAVLTPHRGEALRLFGLKAASEEDLFAKAIRFCNEKKVTVVLKGAPTFIFGPNHKPVIIPRGDPGMASAGTGDVLTGVIAGIMAQGCSPYESAMIGVTLHAISGEFAAQDRTSYCMTATDLLAYLPDAFDVLLKKQEIVPFI